MTSEALITAETLSPTFRARSSAASLMIEEVMWCPPCRATFTVLVTAPTGFRTCQAQRRRNHLDAAVVQEGGQALPVAQRVAHGLRQVRTAGQPRHLLLQPDMQGIHDRPTSRFAHSAPMFGRGAADLRLDRGG